MLNFKEKKNIIKTFSDDKKKNSGCVEVQISILTKEINILKKHMKKNKKDFHSKIGLLKKISKRQKLLKYLHNKNLKRYKKIINLLNLRK